MACFMLPAKVGQEEAYRRIWQVLLCADDNNPPCQLFIPRIRRLLETEDGDWKPCSALLAPGKVFARTENPDALLSQIRAALTGPLVLRRGNDMICRLTEEEEKILELITNGRWNRIGFTAVESTDSGLKLLSGPLTRIRGRIREINPDKRMGTALIPLGGENLEITLGVLPSGTMSTKMENPYTAFQTGLAKLRKHKRLSQCELGRLLGTNQTMVARYETGVNELPIQHLISLVEILEVPPEKILGMDNVTASDGVPQIDFAQRGDRWGAYQQIIREKRIQAGMTQQEVGKALGIAQTVYARYERGANRLPIHHLIRLCEIYGVSATEMLGMGRRERE